MVLNRGVMIELMNVVMIASSASAKIVVSWFIYSVPPGAFRDTSLSHHCGPETVRHTFPEPSLIDARRHPGH